MKAAFLGVSVLAMAVGSSCGTGGSIGGDGAQQSIGGVATTLEGEIRRLLDERGFLASPVSEWTMAELAGGTDPARRYGDRVSALGVRSYAESISFPMWMPDSTHAFATFQGEVLRIEPESISIANGDFVASYDGLIPREGLRPGDPVARGESLGLGLSSRGEPMEFALEWRGTRFDPTPWLEWPNERGLFKWLSGGSGD